MSSTFQSNQEKQKKSIIINANFYTKATFEKIDFLF